jgi:hypothetical protein
MAILAQTLLTLACTLTTPEPQVGDFTLTLATDANGVLAPTGGATLAQASGGHLPGHYSTALITAQTRLAGDSELEVDVATRALGVSLHLIIDPEQTHAFGYGDVDTVNAKHVQTQILVGCETVTAL